MVWKRVNKTLTPRSNIQYLQVIRNSITWHVICHHICTLFVTIFEWFLLQIDRLKQVRTIETARWDLVKGDRDRSPFNRGLKITIIKGHILGTLTTDCLGPVYMVSGTRDNPPPELPWAS